MTERKQSTWEQTWAQLQALRAVRLERMGRPALREDVAFARVNAQLAQIGGALLTLAEEADPAAAPQFVEWAWEEFLSNEWAAGLVPPFPLAAFGNSVMLSKCWAAVEERLADEAALARYERGLR